MSPWYSFKCDTCEDTWAINNPINEELLAPICHNCNEPMIRMWETVGIVFKGDGWAGKS